MTQVVKTKGGTIVEDTVVGKGAEAKVGSMVKVHYKGTLKDGTVFDSSYKRGEPIELKLGSGMVIKGWDEGIVGMKVGGKRTLTIPYSQAYGEAGRPPVIPQKADLIFETELVEVK
ncbi:peptidylprolyl isomerase [candidate division BRC1 bacterium HGW-BRC1-1]|nr:MAG: peptidylprolyl isomerase [candidate division BRC1 bacterium HGW-BRC1-1]